VAETLSVIAVLASLLAVVIGHAMLAQDQVRISSAQAALSAEQNLHRQEVLSVARLETPSRISAEAQNQFHLAPDHVSQLPSVPLSTPLATPKVAAAPVASTPTTTVPTTAATTVPNSVPAASADASGTSGTSSSDPGSSSAGSSTSAPGQ